MDSSLQSTHISTDTSPVVTDQDAAEARVEEEQHVHLPNPSFWPLIVGVAVAVTMGGLLFLPDNPWLSIIAAPFVLIGILGWALEDPMAPLKEKLLRMSADQSGFILGQDVIDKDGFLIGKVQARFNHYVLVERRGLRVKAYYVPQNIAKSSIQKNLVTLSLSEKELIDKGYNSIPDDLYEGVPDYGVPDTSGVAQFSRGPLSPAQTGHYNYGPNYPGINTDASGSYYREEVNPRPQRFVGERRRLYATNRTIPARDVSPD